MATNCPIILNETPNDLISIGKLHASFSSAIIYNGVSHRLTFLTALDTCGQLVRITKHSERGRGLT